MASLKEKKAAQAAARPPQRVGYVRDIHSTRHIAWCATQAEAQALMDADAGNPNIRPLCIMREDGEVLATAPSTMSTPSTSTPKASAH